MVETNTWAASVPAVTSVELAIELEEGQLEIQYLMRPYLDITFFWNELPEAFSIYFERNSVPFLRNNLVDVS